MTDPDLPKLPLPWHYAAIVGRNYITPEDITAAVRGCRTPAEKLALYREVLLAISRDEVEDHRLCAYVAYRCEEP